MLSKLEGKVNAEERQEQSPAAGAKGGSTSDLTAGDSCTLPGALPSATLSSVGAYCEDLRKKSLGPSEEEVETDHGKR